MDVASNRVIGSWAVWMWGRKPIRRAPALPEAHGELGAEVPVLLGSMELDMFYEHEGVCYLDDHLAERREQAMWARDFYEYVRERPGVLPMSCFVRPRFRRSDWQR